MQLRTDTIVALSTPPGRGAIAIVRLSGPDAYDLASRVCSRWPERPREATMAWLRDPESGTSIDQALVTRYDAPRSFTGEPVVEFACHGGAAVQADLIAALVTFGARPAEPGEFTQRAVLNGKLDLLQAEAIAELIDARTSAHRDVALGQLHGSLSQLIAGLRESLLQLEALLVYDVDFPEEDDGPVPRERILEAATAVLERLEHLLASAPLGEVARDGALIVVAGVPNVGKSSLFNALVGEERAIVTEVPGTTRDAIEARIERRPWPWRLVDTAGLRPTADRVERLGIEVSERHLRVAHVVLVCGHRDEELDLAEAQVRQQTSASLVRVRTKGDLLGPMSGSPLTVSAHTRKGLGTLAERIDQELTNNLGTMPTDGTLILRQRHRAALKAACDELSEFIQVWSSGTLPATIASVHVRAGTAALDELVGSVDLDQVMDVVFRSFCVGK